MHTAFIQGFLAVPNVDAEHRGPHGCLRGFWCDQIQTNKQTNKPPILCNTHLDCLDLEEIPKVLRTDILRPPFIKQMHIMVE
jgi:hypothetical protein